MAERGSGRPHADTELLPGQGRAELGVHTTVPRRRQEQGGRCSSRDADVAAVCLTKRRNATFLETYNCNPTPLPRPDHGWRAKKQIYRPSLVLSHYIHYSVVTRRIIDSPREMSPRFRQPRPYERRVDDLSKAFMLHAKTREEGETAGWALACSADSVRSARVRSRLLPLRRVPGGGYSHRDTDVARSRERHQRSTPAPIPPSPPLPWSWRAA